MKKTICKLLCLTLTLSFMVGCGTSGTTSTTGNPTDAPSTDTTGVIEPTAEPTVAPTEAPVVKVPGNIDVNNDGVIKVLMVGNSFCYYYVEELAGMANAAGLSVRISNVYKSGGTVEQLWNNLNADTKAYSMFTTIKFRNELNNVSLKECLEKDEWDVITLQQASKAFRTANYDYAYGMTAADTKSLYDYFKQSNPNALLFWHQTWAYQVGWEAPQKTDPATVPEEEKVLTAEKQGQMHQTIVAIGDTIAQENDVFLIPSSYAWQIARADPRVGDNLCARIGVGTDNSGDNYHDGDIGGGQYLNACIWFEILTHTSCIGNTYRPTYIQGQVYTLSEDMVTALQEAAHAAVAAMYGEDYAK